MHKISELDLERVRIIVEDVRKTFKFRHTHSLKETFIAAIRKKQISSTFDALHDVSAIDPIAFLGATAALLVIGAIAAFVPAYRAGTVDPAIALSEQ